MNIVKPCSEKQALFVESESDITIFNGAGVGKTFGNLLIHFAEVNDPDYSGLLAKGSARACSYAFDEAVELYKDFNIKALNKERRIVFESGARIDFRSGTTHRDVGNYACAGQYDKITIDDASQFDLDAIFYVLSRVRGRALCKKQFYMTCNADEEAQIKPFVIPWLDSEGYPKEELNGKEYYLYRDPELGIVYTSSPEIPWQRSVKFIHDKADNNPYLKDTKYLEYLLSCNKVDSLYYGKW